MWASRPAKSAMEDGEREEDEEAASRKVLLYMSARPLRGVLTALTEVVVVRRRWGWREVEDWRRRRAHSVLEGREDGNRTFIVILGQSEVI